MAAGWQVGLRTLELLEHYFPDFYQQAVAPLPATPATLAGAANAFLAHVGQRLPMYLPNEFDDLSGPYEVLGRWQTRGHDDSLLALYEASLHLDQPQIAPCGIGIQLIRDAPGAHSFDPEPLLSVALWHLCSHTAWGLGVNLARVVAVEERLLYEEQIAPIAPLPADVTPAQLVGAFTGLGGRDGVAYGTLLAYAFGQTHNELANISCEELNYLYNGEMESSWSDLPLLMDLGEEACQIARAYYDWARWVDADPAERLPDVVALIQQAAQAALESAEAAYAQT